MADLISFAFKFIPTSFWEIFTNKCIRHSWSSYHQQCHHAHSLRKQRKSFTFSRRISEARVGTDFSLDNCSIQPILTLCNVFNQPLHCYHFRQKCHLLFQVSFGYTWSNLCNILPCYEHCYMKNKLIRWHLLSAYGNGLINWHLGEQKCSGLQDFPKMYSL